MPAMAIYVVDGYNLIRADDGFARGPLRDQRERLLRWIEDKRPQGSAAVTVVFDGRADVSSPSWTGTTRVIFSDGEADGVVKRLVDELRRPQDAVVVTNDKAIQHWVRGAGAKVMSCEAFMAAARGPRPPRPGGGIEGAGEINDELRRTWGIQ